MKKLVGAVLALLLVAAGTWWVATRVESPDQVAARAEAPAPVPVVAALDRGYLNGPVSLSVAAQYEQTVTVKPPAALTGVVTSAEQAVGDTLEPGSVLLRANGRPVFVLSGGFALYRDIQPGDSGDDVAAVQAGLAAAGYPTGRDRPGTYGAGTQAAVRKMYKAAGYTAPEVAAPAVATADAGSGTGTGTEGTGTDAATAAAPSSTPAVVAGPRVLRSEVLMLAGLPATVQAVAPVGALLDAETDLLTLGAGRIVLSATLPRASVGALTVGATGTFVDAAGADGVAAVATMTATASADETVVVLTTDAAVAAGAAYVLTVANPAAEAGDSLLAPVAAVVTRGGRSYVYPREGEEFGEVEVTVTGAVGGVAAIVPVDPGAVLDDGTEVRVG
ncbi:peptidoglycan-binding protein [Cellulomonas hominis]|uniref:peptidoglycan-binding protein n=1 Tax=Cellulomonas hominis TaxID=156981 RepID=UPI001C104F95|nr:peptidoglycan-binding protein [Cellulomonas hominis]MBU5422551.1 peptidoglycan-binding protein [Cellulomonas hominis]